MVKTCRCGNEVWVRKTGECQRCYHRRYHREVIAPRRRAEAAAAPLVERVPTRGPCGYSAAHSRIRRWRGRAADYTCRCGQPAIEWSYRGGSPREQRGTRDRQWKGKVLTIQTTWSPDIEDYDPLCRACHRERDGHWTRVRSQKRTLLT